MSSNSNKSNSVAMDLEKLQQDYSTLLIKYRAAVSDYMLSLNNKTTKPNLVIIQGQSYLGTGSAGVSNATKLQDCVASCSSNSKCTGATFISNKCDIRIGDTDLTPSTSNSYAIVPKQKQLLMNMEEINSRLLIINKEINDKIQVYQPQFYKNTEEGKKRTEELIKNYENLMRERENIIELMRENETLDITENQNQLITNRNYYAYIILSIFAIIVFYFLYKVSFTTTSPTIQYGGDLGINAYYILFILILTIIAINFLLRYFSI